MSFQQRTPAVWNQVNEHFSVSEGGSLKPAGDGYKGMACYLTLDAAQHILDNAESFRRAIEIQRGIVLKKTTMKERAKLVQTMVKSGLTTEQAVQAVEQIFANAAKQKSA